MFSVNLCACECQCSCTAMSLVLQCPCIAVLKEWPECVEGTNSLKGGSMASAKNWIVTTDRGLVFFFMNVCIESNRWKVRMLNRYNTNMREHWNAEEKQLTAGEPRGNSRKRADFGHALSEPGCIPFLMGSHRWRQASDNWPVRVLTCSESDLFWQ